MAVLKVYCECCDEHMVPHIERAVWCEINKMYWGDIVCDECKFVIGTYSADCEGRLIFVEDK